MRQRLLAAVLAVVAIGPATAADEPVTVRLKKPAAGESVRDTKNEEIDVNQTVDGKARPQLQVRTKVDYTDKAVEGDGRAKPTKLERTFKTMEVSAGEKLNTGLEGKTVLVQKGKEKYTFTIDGKDVPATGAKILDGEFNTKDDPEVLMLPTKPVKTGDTWDLPVKAVDKLFGEEFVVDAGKAKATGKLVKVYDKNKSKYGVIEYTVELPVTALVAEGKAYTADASSLLKGNITYDGCIDGTVYESSSTGTLTGEVKAKAQGADVVIKINGKFSTKSEPAK